MKKGKPGPKPKKHYDGPKPRGFSCTNEQWGLLQDWASKKEITVSEVIRGLIEEKRRKIAKVKRGAA